MKFGEGITISADGLKTWLRRVTGTLHSWGTVTTHPSFNFEIERSSDGRTFNRVGWHRAETTLNEYAFTDDVSGLVAQSIFYRLKLNLSSGGYRYSNVLLFRNGNENDRRLSVYPNPATKDATISFAAQKAGIADVEMINVAGVVIRKTQVRVLPGRNTLPLTLAEHMVPGTYFLQVKMNGEWSRIAVVIQ